MLLEKYNLHIEEKNGLVGIGTDREEVSILAQFLNYWDRASYVKEYLLPEVDCVINGNLKYNDIGAGVVGIAYIEHDKTKLLGSELGDAPFSLSTKDFKDLIDEWLQILERYS